MCVCVSPSPRRLSGAGTYALGRPRSGGAPAACPGVGWGRAACHSRRLWGGGGRPGRASRSAGLRGAPRGSAAAAAASRGRPCPPSAAPSRGSLPRPGVCGERWSGNGGLQPPPAPRPCCLRCVPAGKRASSSGELRLSLGHSIFLPLVKPLCAATSITSRDSCLTPLATWSLTLLVKTVNRFAFLKQIIRFVSPPGCLYSFQ